MSLSRERLHLENPLISQPFTDDFARRFSWSTNAIEGNTLSLEETIAVIDYDEVRSNHTYLEYTVVKNAYHAIQKMLLPFAKTVIDEEWVRKANGYITGIFRKSPQPGAETFQRPGETEKGNGNNMNQWFD